MGGLISLFLYQRASKAAVLPVVPQIDQNIAQSPGGGNYSNCYDTTLLNEGDPAGEIIGIRHCYIGSTIAVLIGDVHFEK